MGYHGYQKPQPAAAAKPAARSVARDDDPREVSLTPARGYMCAAPGAKPDSLHLSPLSSPPPRGTRIRVSERAAAAVRDGKRGMHSAPATRR